MRGEDGVVEETRYVAGDGVLLGAGSRWLLLTDPGDERVLDELWTMLQGPPPPASRPLTERVMEVVDRAFDGEVPDLVLLDLTSGSPVSTSRGAGRLRVEGQRHHLSLSAPAVITPAGGPARRLLGGVVPARSAEVTLRSAAGNNGAGLIDGIPQEILAAKGPAGPPPRRPRPSTPRPATPRPDDSVARDTTEPDPALMARIADAAPALVEQQPRTPVPTGSDQAPAEDHDGSTVFRPEHLTAAPAGETVQAVWCPQGHLTRPTSALCRVCRTQVAPQHPQRVPRPTLGGLRLPTGEVVPLDRSVVLGRRPQPMSTSPADWPHLVTLPAEHTFVSRMHLHLSLEGWDVVARDLGSRGGTTLKVPGQAPVRMVQDHPYVLEPGHALDLADTYEVRFEVGPEVGVSGP
ncbi:FHA domain-containing protein [Nocardioides sp. 616]|uniref:FHA domain-containing protein n=1 Tax=Nocardioides sp. 616 TaxID=2268090 RepID=UPI0013B456E4|nr:FHA domain-containing protein [Nocardioides sp. 616]